VAYGLFHPVAGVRQDTVAFFNRLDQHPVSDARPTLASLFSHFLNPAIQILIPPPFFGASIVLDWARLYSVA
jgi:hypothetical protein